MNQAQSIRPVRVEYVETELANLAKQAKLALDHWHNVMVSGGEIELVVAGERMAGLLSRLQTLDSVTKR